MNKKEKRKYQVRDVECYDRNCFIPFTGNGVKVCRLYEMGRCPEKYRELKTIENRKNQRREIPCFIAKERRKSERRGKAERKKRKELERQLRAQR